MGIGVLTLAVRKFRVIMAPALIARHHLVQKRPHIVQQCILPLVNEYSGCCMERLQVNKSIPDAALVYDLVNAIGNIDELHALACDPIHDTVEDFEAGCCRLSPIFSDQPSFSEFRSSCAHLRSLSTLR